MLIDVYFLPQNVMDMERRVCIVVDVLRASSSIVTLFERGCRHLILAETVNQARQLKRAHDYVLCGEEEHLPPQGFDYGNSPAEFSRLDFKGKEVILKTSNGTRAIHVVAPAPKLFVGCFLNGTAVVKRALAEAQQGGYDLALVCAGRELGTSFGLDDTVCAGYIADVMARELGNIGIEASSQRSAAASPQGGRPVGPGQPGPALYHLDDSVHAVRRLYRSYIEGKSPTDGVFDALSSSRAGRRLTRLGLHSDVAYCCQLETSKLAPYLEVAPDGTLGMVV